MDSLQYDERDKQELIREKYPNLRGDELQWEEPDVTDKELEDWRRKKFQEKQDELAERIKNKIDFSKVSDVYVPQWVTGESNRG